MYVACEVYSVAESNISSNAFPESLTFWRFPYVSCTNHDNFYSFYAPKGWIFKISDSERMEGHLDFRLSANCLSKFRIFGNFAECR